MYVKKCHAKSYASYRDFCFARLSQPPLRPIGPEMIFRGSCSLGVDAREETDG